MSHFADKSPDHLKASTFHSCGVLKAGTVHCYKHPTPNGVKSKSSRARISCTTQLVDSYIDQTCVNCCFGQIQCKIKLVNLSVAFSQEHSYLGVSWSHKKHSLIFARGLKMKQAAKVFLCYAKEDKPQVEQLYQKLKDAGLAPWMDKVDLVGGEEWRSAIQKAIRESHFFVACVSKHWIPTNPQDRKRFFRREIQTALDVLPELAQGDIFVIPIRLEECEVPDKLSLFQWIDYFQKDGWDRLLHSIHKGMDQLGLIKPIKLRFKPKALSDEDAMAMIEGGDFYDSQRKKSGKGLQHQYESIEQHGKKLVIDYTAGLMWQQSGSENVMPSSRTTSYLEELNNFQFAGYSDWRLPTLEEAMSLVEPISKNGDLHIDSIFDPKQSWIWTSDYDPLANFRWGVGFAEGYYPIIVYESDIRDRYYVRAVRSG
jgi:TIR domain/Protein of unknown function (DUF1566)